MSARTVIGVSLKLYLDTAESEQWAARVADIARSHPGVLSGDVRLFVLPSLPSLGRVRAALGDARVEVGAQDLFWEERGPYTGGVSGADLRTAGCTIAEVGHLERRRVFGEDDRIINRKTAAAFRTGLSPLLCVGERSPEGVDVAIEEVVGQVESALYGIPRPEVDPGLIVAYEPQWAIGGDAPAAPERVMAVVAAIRDTLAAHPWLRRAPVIYGGSAGPGALTALAAGVDGLFLGRFAHDPEAFARVLDETLG